MRVVTAWRKELPALPLQAVPLQTGLRKLGESPSAYLGVKSDSIAGWQAAHCKEKPQDCAASEGGGASGAPEIS